MESEIFQKLRERLSSCASTAPWNTIIETYKIDFDLSSDDILSFLKNDREQERFHDENHYDECLNGERAYKNVEKFIVERYVIDGREVPTDLINHWVERAAEDDCRKAREARDLNGMDDSIIDSIRDILLLYPPEKKREAFNQRRQSGKITAKQIVMVILSGFEDNLTPEDFSYWTMELAKEREATTQPHELNSNIGGKIKWLGTKAQLKQLFLTLEGLELIEPHKKKDGTQNKTSLAKLATDYFCNHDGRDLEYKNIMKESLNNNKAKQLDFALRAGKV
jgi:hypothetical protein